MVLAHKLQCMQLQTKSTINEEEFISLKIVNRFFTLSGRIKPSLKFALLPKCGLGQAQLRVNTQLASGWSRFISSQNLNFESSVLQFLCN